MPKIIAFRSEIDKLEFEALYSSLLTGVVKLEFIKWKDNEIRVMYCTLNKSWFGNKEPKSNREPSTDEPTYLSVFDVEKDDWRAFCLSRVLRWEPVVVYVKGEND